MHFVHPTLLYGLLLLPLLALLFFATHQGRLRRLQDVLEPRRAAADGLRTLGLRRQFRGLTLWAALGLVIVALARPQWGEEVREVTYRGLDLIVALDCSTSMLAEDLKPNRIARARHAVKGLLNRLDGDRFGLVAFAGTAFLQCPLTVDYGAAKMFLDLVDTTLFKTQGTDLAAAVTTAIRGFGEERRGDRVLIVVSDGEGQADGLESAIAAAKAAEVRVYTIGIGSPNGVPMPMRDPSGRLDGYKKDRRGEVVLTRLNEEGLARLALATGGTYFRAHPGEAELDELVATLGKLSRGEGRATLTIRRQERYAWFLAPALVLLAVDAAWPVGRKAAEEAA
jgi:Ca-activated chloride channel family protein